MNTTILLGMLGLGGQEIFLILLIVLLLFGGAKIPKLMKGLGQGINEFKKGMKGEDIDTKAKENIESK